MPLGAVLSAALSQSMELVQADRSALDRIPFTSRSFSRETPLLRMGDAPVDLQVILGGVAGRVAITGSGERQIVGFLLPGDVFDWRLYQLNSRLAPADRVGVDHGVVALSNCTVALVRGQVLGRTLEDYPPIAEAFERRAVRDQVIEREAIVNLAARRAVVRLGHLICEFYARLSAMRLVQGNSCHLPLTQVHLAEALGLSPVHVNRGLQVLRSEHLLHWSGGVLSVLDLPRLERTSDFTAAYLEAGRSRRGPRGDVERPTVNSPI